MTSTLARTLGEVARSSRTARGWSQADAADAIGISHEFYARIERGGTMPSVPTLAKICSALGVSADALLGNGAPLHAGRVREAGPAYTLDTPRPRPLPEESPELRHLVRRLRRASPKTLRLLNAVAAAIEGRPRGTG